MMSSEQLTKNFILNEVPKCKECGKEYLKINMERDNRCSEPHFFPHCKCQYGNWERRKAKEIGIEKVERLRKLKSSIGLKYQNKNFGNFNKSQNQKAYYDCLEYAKNIKDYIKNGKGLFLSGTVGTGKTHLLAAIIDYAARIKKQYIDYYNIVSLLNNIRFTFKRKYEDSLSTEEITNRLKKCSVLMIDDMGTENLTDWASEILFDIIDYRYSNLKSMVISTNLSTIEIKEKLDERLMSRIYEMCKGIKLIGKDYRIFK
jgi:DNA replication protein DnaC